jgi:Rhodopirellula transposase DDE domain
VKQRNEEADEASQVLRLSIDAKATVRVGPFARGGKSRVPTRAADHDFTPVATVTPVGIFLPASDELFLFGVTSKVTSDCLVDRLIDWWESVKERFSPITTLLINLDNGPESHSRRTEVS